MFVHTHPYQPFVRHDTTRLIVGTLPPPRFTTGELKERDVDFCYGSRDGQLWPILDQIYHLNLIYETTWEAIEQRQNFLIEKKIGICDIVERANRNKVDASDLGMENIELRDLLGILHQFKNVDTLLFTGGNSKNGPEFLFRKLLKSKGITLYTVENTVPRKYRFTLTEHPLRTIETISLTAPSGAANRAVGSMAKYKELKSKNPQYNTFDFRVDQYRSVFMANTD